MTNIKNYRNEFILLSVFIIVNVVMYLFSIDPSAPLSVGADAGQYLRPARSLVDYGEFAMNPPGWTPEMGESRSFTFGTPLYSILLAVPYYFFGQGEMFYASVIIIQCSLLYLTGWISRLFLPFFNSKRILLIHSLVIFNPNSLTTAHLIQSETLFALFLVITLLYIFKYIKHNSISSLIVVGVLVGLLALIRPAGLYLIYIIPIILIAIQIFRRITDKSSDAVHTQMVNSVVLILVAFLVISPWYIRNYVNTGQVFFTSNSGYYLKANHLELLRRGTGNRTEKEIIEIIDSEHLEYFRNNGVSTSCLYDERNIDCSKYVATASLTGIFNEPIESTKYVYY